MLSPLNTIITRSSFYAIQQQKKTKLKLSNISSVQFIPINMKRSTTITTKYKSVRSTFAHGRDSKKTKRSLKSAAIALIKFESNYSHK